MLLVPQTGGLLSNELRVDTAGRNKLKGQELGAAVSSQVELSWV